MVGCWDGYLCGERCRLAYGPADATATHCHPCIPGKRAVKRVCVCVNCHYRHAGCLQLSHRRLPELCGLRTCPRMDLDPPRFLPPSNCHWRGAYCLVFVRVMFEVKLKQKKYCSKYSLQERVICLFLSNVRYFSLLFDAVGWASGRASGL